jgi:hypothetical protein
MVLRPMTTAAQALIHNRHNRTERCPAVLVHNAGTRRLPEFYVVNDSSLSYADPVELITDYLNLLQIRSGDSRTAVMADWTGSARVSR